MEMRAAATCCGFKASLPAVLLVLAAVLLCGPRSALAHGGILHRYSFNPNVQKYVPTAALDTDIHTTVAQCNTWTVLNLAALTPSAFVLPWAPAQLNLTISGYIDVISYIANNCTSGATGALSPLLRFSVSLKQSDKWVSRPPPNGLSTFGYGFTGTCAAPGNLYRNNVTLQDNRFNLAWWGEDGTIGLGMDPTDTYPGYVWGTAPNSWLFRNATDPNRMKSIVIFTQAGPAFCCNLNYANYPAPDALLSRAQNCSYVDDGSDDG